MTLLVPLSLIIAETVRGSLTFPSFNDVLPCPNTPENCAKQYYNYQTNQQTQLDHTYNSAADAQDSAGALLTTVQSLLGNSTALVAQIDPDNSRTNGGEIRTVSATQTNLVGVTPFMATISQRMVNAANQRESDLANLVSSLSSGMNQITNVLKNAQIAANSQFTSMTGSFLSSIAAQSSSLQDYFTQTDAKLMQASSLFDTSSNAGPNSTANGLIAALRMEGNDFTNTQSRLVGIYNQIASLPAELSRYLNTSIATLTAFQQNQEVVGNSLAANTSASFASSLNHTANSLTAKLKGILATSISDPYYNSSLTAYMAAQESGLQASMLATNQSQQVQIDAMLNSLKAVSKTVTMAFQPILNDMATWVTKIVAQDAAFQTDAQTAFNDANATVLKTNSSFTAFASNMQNIWNTTGSILSGQTTSISANLLNQIGNMTNQAGAEVNNLNKLMLEASTSALQSDAVRQAILNGSSQEVLTFIGSNAVAVNQSMATITNFLNNSQSEIALIMNVLQLMSGSQLSQLNQTAVAAIAGLNRQIGLMKNGTSVSLENLMASVNQYLQTSQNATNLVYAALQQAGQSSLNQSLSLISAMDLATNQTLNQTQTGLDRTIALVNRAVSDSNLLASTVNGIPTQAQQEQQNQLRILGEIVSNANSNLSAAQTAINTQFLQVKQTIEQAASQLGTDQSNAVQTMTSVLNNASALFDQQTTSLTSQFNQLLSALQANVTISEARMNELQSQLTAAASAADSQYASSLAAVQNAESSETAALRSAISAYVTAMKQNVSNEASARVDAVSSNVSGQINNLTTLMTSIQGNVSALSATVSVLQNTPQSLVDKARQLQTQFATQLNALKKSIVDLSADNDERSSRFEAQVNATFGNSVFDTVRNYMGIDGLLNALGLEIKSAESSANQAINNGVSSLKYSISVSESALNVSASGFLAQINSQRNQTAISVNNIVQGAYDFINTTVKAFSNNVSSLNASIYNTLNASALLQARLDNLQAQINGTASLVGNSTDASLLSDLVSRYGANMAQEVQDLMNSSQVQLSEAQKTAVLQQLVTANSAFGAAAGLNSTGTALASAVQAVINQVKAASNSMQANTDALNAKLNIVSLSANNTVAISANQIAAIISKYSQDAASTQAAIAAQFAAAGNASITVQAALKVFDSLKDSALNLTTDQLEDLKQTQSEVFDFTDDSLHQAQSQADSDVKNLTDSMTDINKRLSHSHQSNMAIVDSLLAQLNQIAASAADQKSGFEQQVGNLRGSVNSLINQLNARYTSITAQGAQFKSAVESAAAQDIAALTVNG